MRTTFTDVCVDFATRHINPDSLTVFGLTCIRTVLKKIWLRTLAQFNFGTKLQLPGYQFVSFMARSYLLPYFDKGHFSFDPLSGGYLTFFQRSLET